ncbi:asparaginase [Provencibacterium massiliense]|uniref:asparaginase n=1 Tax=Provencibacterium massiliense TaxID=1841868 RepID=UPI001FA928B4|nr:asparaginase [Provencibacterium massiliense]
MKKGLLKRMKKILLIATGGTIASKKTQNGLAPQLSPQEMLRFLPDFGALCSVDCLQPLCLDSTNIRPEHWLLLASLVEQHYAAYDGFVICHGTDTLAYTSAALSYLLQRCQKPVILTGAQLPIDEEITDAKTNLLDSLRCACSDLQGVYLCFNGHVIVGTRARKTRSKSYNAFSSINFPDLATIRDGHIVRYIPAAQPEEPRFYHRLNTRVFLLKLIPGLPPEAFSAVGELCDGLILESYGVGGIPAQYLEALDRLIAAGKTVVMATQVPQEGSDLSVYEVGHLLKERYDLLETYDMTLESTVTKLMWVLGQTGDPQQVRRLFYRTVHYNILFHTRQEE